MNSITELLDLEDSDVFISDITIQGTTKFIAHETKLCTHHCPACGFKMHSRGIKKRTTNATDMLIVYAYRNLMETSAFIAARFHVSDSYVHEVFDRYKEQKIYFHQWLEKLICKSLSPRFFQHSFFLFCKIKSTVQKCKLLIIIFYKRHKNHLDI